MPDTATVDISLATPADVPALSRTLAQAFYDDPVFKWIIPDAAYRSSRLTEMFAVFAEAFLPHRETYVSAAGAGAALWAPAGQDPIPADQLEAFGARLCAALQDDMERGLQVQELLDQHHPDQDCFYLQFIGVAPDQQGRGLGSRLLTSVLQRCDATGTPAYLEATSVSNRRLYQRHGFETTGELSLPQGPPLWPMWRAPR